MARHTRDWNIDTVAAMTRFCALALRHRVLITLLVLGAVVFNLSFVPQVERGDSGRGDLPVAARCHGGGEGCTEQPLVPPPAIGMPRLDAVPPANMVTVEIPVVPAPEPRSVLTLMLAPPPELA
jgi:hypothetical protein